MRHQKCVCSGLFLLGITGSILAQTNQLLSLNGTSAYVLIPSSASLQPSAAITVEAWVFPVSGVHNPIFISKSDGQTVNSDRTYELAWPGGGTSDPSGVGGGIQFNLFLGTSTWAAVGAPATSNQWVHVAGTYSSVDGLLQLYTNGVLATSTLYDASGTIPLAGQLVRQSSQPLYFGVIGNPSEQSGSGGTWASGFLDEIRIWNTNRTKVEIAENRFCRLTGTESNLAAYWNFDDGSVTDLTTNNANGTLEGGAAIMPIAGEDPVHAGICGAPYFDFASLNYSTTDGFHERLYGPSGLTLEVDESGDLTNWVPLLILPDFPGVFEFNDLEATNAVQRFYRIVPQ